MSDQAAETGTDEADVEETAQDEQVFANEASSSEDEGGSGAE